MVYPIYQVDAFTAVPFGGNPAAVCLLDGPTDVEWMRQVAVEMNLAETAFVEPHGDDYRLRWFSPAVEVDLCGHATLATAHVLWETGRLATTRQARFHTKSGVLTAAKLGDWIELDFPATPDSPEIPPPGLIDALGVAPLYVGRSVFDYLVHVEHEDEVRALSPDFRALASVGGRGVIVTARARETGVDFVSRFFGPQTGIDEDAVTGSAHCCLGPFWARQLGKTTFLAHQVSARGGVLRVTLDGERVKLGGQAVTVVAGTLIA
jgi:PhzF family phenazine biosynthesis protein